MYRWWWSSDNRGCGAVAVAPQRRPDAAEGCLCAAIRPAIARAHLCPGDLCDQTVRAHVQGVADGLRQAFTARHGGRAAAVGAVYDLASGVVEFLDRV